MQIIEDISRGLESLAVKGYIKGEHLLSLNQTFTASQYTLSTLISQYITDSVLPDGRYIAEVPLNSLEVSNDTTEEDSQSESSIEVDEVWTCNCPQSVVKGSCTADAADCDCVDSFGGNFYTHNSPQRLILDALPENLPLVECSPSCTCDSACSSRLTQRGVCIDITIKQSHAGLGAFYSPKDDVPLPAGSFISLYAGEYLTSEQARERWSRGYKDNYILSLRLANQILHIDPRYKGNIGRFLNHSCDPNCVIQIVKWGAGQDVWPRAAIFTNKSVSPDEELTFDYGNASGSEGWDPIEEDQHLGENGRTKCSCGSEKCRGYMPFDETL